MSVIGLCLSTGLGLFAGVVVTIDWSQALDTYSWQETSCSVVSSRVTDEPVDGEYVLEVLYSYSYGGQTFGGDAYRHGGAEFGEIADAEREQARYATGADVRCWVDPDDPARSYLRRANLWRGLWIFVPLLFVGVGAGALWFLLGSTRPRTTEEKSPISSGGPKSFKVAATMVGFFGLFLVVGVGMLVPFFIRPALQVAEARAWDPVPCQILSSGVRTHSGDDSDTYSIEALYRYEIEGREHLSSRYQFMSGSSSGYQAKADAVAGIPAGSEVTCYVNPDDPFEAVIERGFTTDYLFGLIPLLFALVGLGGIVFTVSTARAMKRDASKPNWSSAASTGRRPSVASSGPIVLEPRMGPLGKLGCMTVVALFWNGIVALFVWQLVTAWRAGEHDWFLALFLVPFVLIGLLLAAGVPYGILALVNPRPRLRLSQAAIAAGDTAEISWTFLGDGGRIRRLRLWLEQSRTTTEVRVGDSGGSVRQSTEVVDTIEILERGPGTPLEFGSTSVSLPDDAPPTTEGNEAISWKLKLHGSIDYWPDVVEEYEIRVLPYTEATD